MEEPRASREAVAQRLAAMDRLIDEAAQRAYCGESGGRAAAAHVDGNGRLLALDIDPAALRTGHPERVGPEVVASVAAARERAAGERAQRVRDTFGRRERA